MQTSRIVDLSGQTFGRLVVVARNRENRITRYVCKCACGNLVLVRHEHLQDGSTKSCGCFRKERAGLAATTHGKSKTPEYKVWYGMLRRCSDSTINGWENYGGRGIKVCNRWKKFENFYLDMGLRPSNKHTLERKDTNGNYVSKNCIWATRKRQSNNTRTNRILRFQGQVLTVSEWSDKLGLKIRTLSHRVNFLNWSVERALTMPVRKWTKKVNLKDNTNEKAHT